MLALFLGAGFSKWAGDLPLGSQLFDFAVESFGVREQHRLQRLIHHKQNWDAANPAGLAEQFIASVLSGDEDRSKEDVLWYIASSPLKNSRSRGLGSQDIPNDRWEMESPS